MPRFGHDCLDAPPTAGVGGECIVNRIDIAAVVIASASEISGVLRQDIAMSTTFDQLGFDSLDTILLIAAVEDDCGVEIGCGERMDLDTVDQVVDLVASKTLRLAA
jgi:acyl carrier protein